LDVGKVKEFVDDNRALVEFFQSEEDLDGNEHSFPGDVVVFVLV
jgi:hypothetical protein